MTAKKMTQMTAKKTQMPHIKKNKVNRKQPRI